MPDDSAPTGKVERGPVDGSRVLNGLKSILESHKPAGGGSSILGTVIVIAIALIGTAIFSWISWRRGRELAKLRHEREKRRIEAEQAVLEKRVAEGDKQIGSLKKEFDDAAKNLVVIDEQIARVEASHAKDKATIDSIRSWGDVATGGK